MVEDMDLEGGTGGLVLVARVRPAARAGSRCPRCGRRCRGHDRGKGRRRWRGLDLGTVRVFLEADSPRVSCPEHRVVTAAVPWARPGSRFTRGFEETCAWLAAHAAFTMAAVLLRVSWRAVSGIVTLVVAELAGTADRLDGLRKMGIDEIAYRKGHRYLLAVTDHELAGSPGQPKAATPPRCRPSSMLSGWTGRRGSRMCPLTARSGSTTWCARRRARRCSASIRSAW